MTQAPFHADVDEGPAGGRAVWLTASDGVRIRVGYWPCDGARGTVLLFPGRTEYIEKYGRAAADFAMRGYATLAVDWRGQGLADRVAGDPAVGHVGHFSDYQADAAAVVAAMPGLDLPAPWHLVGHSMGGAIGLRALMEGLPVASAAFTGPMWGIELPLALRPVAWALSAASARLGLGERLSPGTKAESYVLAETFEDNKLTTDTEMYNYMQRQTRAHPELGLGGPTMHWLYEALFETRRLSRLPAPDVPGLTFLGTDEEIVSADRIRARMDGWPGGRLEMLPGGRHEVMMEDPATRTRVFDMAVAHFDAHGPD
ncbi:alpha/beta fold hydrolase [Pseudooceanicola aestuarii]|uniref:alpha/beta fold hydrolase n=1 Tax=Pseudooceanicola aestuarii TaxID=2697319 RepID=UPI0013D4A209|nr:alpha/beta hydrolase [Pseudooceanicola aestuarii]